MLHFLLGFIAVQGQYFVDCMRLIKQEKFESGIIGVFDKRLLRFRSIIFEQVKKHGYKKRYEIYFLHMKTVDIEQGSLDIYRRSDTIARLLEGGCIIDEGGCEFLYFGTNQQTLRNINNYQYLWK